VEVAKVKKRTGLTGVRNTRPVRRPVKKKGKSVKTKAGPVGRKAKKAKGKPVKARKALPPAPVVRVAVKALDPLRKCGPGTTVQELYRVDETVDGRSTPHLVFFDRHGWYCEHGRNCPAVGHVRKRNGRIARVS
jgi:hypothetical protein